MKLSIVIWTIVVVGFLAFWGTIFYVAAHFIVKF